MEHEAGLPLGTTLVLDVVEAPAPDRTHEVGGLKPPGGLNPPNASLGLYKGGGYDKVVIFAEPMNFEEQKTRPPGAGRALVAVPALPAGVPQAKRGRLADEHEEHRPEHPRAGGRVRPGHRMGGERLSGLAAGWRAQLPGECRRHRRVAGRDHRARGDGPLGFAGGRRSAVAERASPRLAAAREQDRVPGRAAEGRASERGAPEFPLEHPVLRHRRLEEGRVQPQFLRLPAARLQAPTSPRRTTTGSSCTERRWSSRAAGSATCTAARGCVCERGPAVETLNGNGFASVPTAA